MSAFFVRRLGFTRLAAVRLATIAVALFALSGCPHENPHPLDDGGMSHADATPPPDGAGAICTGLDETSCLAHAGCHADYCQLCSCGPTYVGCRDTGATPLPCPAVACPQPMCCHGNTECSGAICVTPGTDLGCGVCMPGDSTCATDHDCTAMGPAMICEPVRCSCTGATACAMGCTTNDQCGPGHICGADHRCNAKPCPHGATDCPIDYYCALTPTPPPGGGPFCEPKTCSSDTECAPHFCVNNTCQPTLGRCEFPPP